ncbi:TetR/AcrR family transcriptional regulator [Pseudonocardiaceae bacterium YIM PH 21723]|nr:TetR/AcrR family transcriptional regulator [Pseudonocardiaceae bacterium YIM PH 21723]
MRRRGDELERAILDAAVAELEERGYPGLTMERVAARAGTNKNTLYRRWPNRAALGLDAYRSLARARTELPDTGSLRADVLELLRAANRHWSSPLGRILQNLLADLAAHPEQLARFREAAGDGSSELWLSVLRRAVDRGEVTSGVLHPRVATVPVALLRNEFLARGVAEVPDEVLVEIVDEVYLPLLSAR